MRNYHDPAVGQRGVADATVEYYDGLVHSPDLGIPFDDSAPPRPGRHRRRPPSERGTGRTLVALLVVVAVFAGGALGAWWAYGEIQDRFGAPDYSGPGTGEAVVQIHDGDTVTAIANTLYQAGVVKSARAFVQAAADDDRSQTLQPGTFKLRKKMEASRALAMLLDPRSKILKRFTVREGLTVKEILELVSQKTGLPLAELQAAAKDPAALGVPSWARPSQDKPVVLEGFLFPATYDLEPGEDAKALLTRMVQKANAVMTADRFTERASRLNLGPWDLLKVASLVEQEGVKDDFGKIARVAYNRLKNDEALRFDSTTQYWLILQGKGRKAIVTDAELKHPENDYSTTLNRGLPPTPISNPGKAAMDAAAEPEEGDWLYFVVTEPDGHSSFATTLAEHERNVVKCKQIGRC